MFQSSPSLRTATLLYDGVDILTVVSILAVLTDGDQYQTKTQYRDLKFQSSPSLRTATANFYNKSPLSLYEFTHKSSFFLLPSLFSILPTIKKVFFPVRTPRSFYESSPFAPAHSASRLLYKESCPEQLFPFIYYSWIHTKMECLSIYQRAFYIKSSCRKKTVLSRPRTETILFPWLLSAAPRLSFPTCSHSCGRCPGYPPPAAG